LKKVKNYRDGTCGEGISLGTRGQSDYPKKEEENKKIVE
jgi:hypothetical protein